MMYREPIKIYYYETYEYDRKSRTDDPLMSVEEVLKKHAKILEDYAKEHNLLISGGTDYHGDKKVGRKIFTFVNIYGDKKINEILNNICSLV